MKDSWNEIVDKIDMKKLALFDWKKWRGTFLAKQARIVVDYLKSLMDSNTFPRDDLKVLLQLVSV